MYCVHPCTIITKQKNNNKNRNNNNNNEMVMLNELLDDHLTPNISSDSSISGISSLKENDGTIGNRVTYHDLNGNGSKLSHLQLTSNDLGGSGAVLSFPTKMICNNNRDNNTDLSETQDDLEQLKQLSDCSDGSIVSTSSTAAILHNSEDDDDDD